MTIQIDYSAVDALLANHHLPTNVVVKLIQLLMAEDSNFREITGELEKNAILTAKVFNLINSGYYYLPHKITDIHHAVSLLGLDKLRELLLCVLFYEHTKTFSLVTEEERKRFFFFAFVSALITQRISQIKGIPIHGQLYSQMLLRHVGLLFLYELKFNEMTEVTKVNGETLQQFLDGELSQFGLTHVTISRYVLEKWHLPKSFIDSACYSSVTPDIAIQYKIMTFCEEFVWAVLSNHIIEELPYFFIFTEKELLMSLSLLDDTLASVLPKIQNFLDTYGLNNILYKDFENIHKFFMAEKHEFSRDVIVTLNKRLYKQEFLHGFLKNLVYGDPMKAFQSFFSTFTTYFRFDRVLFFEKNSHGYVIREYLANVNTDIFQQQTITMPDDFGGKKWYTEQDKLLHSSFLKRIESEHYYIFPVPSPNSNSGFIYADNAISQRTVSSEEIDEVTDFLSYTGMIYLRLCADESSAIKERLHLVHDMAVTLNHRINSPLTIILGTLELLKRKLPDDTSLCDKINGAVMDISSVLKEFEESDSVSQSSYLARKTMLHANNKKGDGYAEKN